MNKFLIAGLVAAALTPVAAEAQHHGGGGRGHEARQQQQHREVRQAHREVHQDRRVVRQDRRQLQQARQRGSIRQVHEARHDLRNSRQEVRHDVRRVQRDYARNDWRTYRGANRAIYRGAGWRAPFRYRTFSPGVRLTTIYYAPRYYIGDYGRYHLHNPGYNRRWVRHYNDVLLVDTRTGLIIDVLRNFFW